MRTRWALVILLGPSVVPAAEFQVSTQSSSYYMKPDLAVDASGNVTFVWEREDPSTHAEDIFGRRYGANGTALAAPFQANTSATGAVTHYPTVAVAPPGNFGVVWLAVPGLMGRRYNSSGTATTGETTLVASPTFKVGTGAAVGRGTVGQVLAWARWTTGNFSDLFARIDTIFGPGTEFKVNTQNGFGVVDSVDVAQDPSGNFVVVWQSSANGVRVDVFARRYDSSGTALGPEFQVSSAPDVTDWPAVAVDGAGNLTIVWRRRNESTIYARRYAASGIALGPEFRVDAEAGTNYPRDPAVAATSSGNVLVTWSAYVASASHVRTRLYKPDGSSVRLCDEVGSDTTRLGGTSNVAATPTNGFVVAWDARPATTPNSWHVFGRQLPACGAVLDSDEDGICDDVDNCPCVANPDQRNSDAQGGGDLCDPCPSDPTDTCDTTRSGAATIGPPGGTLTAGNVTITIPPNVMAQPTSVSITALASSDFGIGDAGPTVDLVKLQPEGVTFNPPVTVRFAWTDTTTPGIVDGTSISEDALRVYKNGGFLTRRCDATSCQAPTCATSSTCTFGFGSPGSCCDTTADTWTVVLTGFSEFLLARKPVCPILDLLHLGR